VKGLSPGGRRNISFFYFFYFFIFFIFSFLFSPFFDFFDFLFLTFFATKEEKKGKECLEFCGTIFFESGGYGFVEKAARIL